MHGQFVWHELTTPDVTASRNFYPRIAGWSTEEGDSDYVHWTLDGHSFGGMLQLTPEMRRAGIPPNWMPYIEVNSVEESARQAETLGGSAMVGPQDIPGTGRFAVVKDPQGAVFAIYKSNTGSQGWDGTPMPGRFSWNELMTTDHQAAYDFYRRLFGWEKTGEFDMGTALGLYQMYGMNGKSFGGMYNRGPDMAGIPPFWLSYINVRDVKKAVDVATKAGAKLQSGPMDVPGGFTIAILADPQGAAFAVVQETSKAPAKSKTRVTAKASARTRSKTKAKSRPKAKSKSRPKAKPKTRASKKAKAKGRARKKSRR